MAGVTLLELMIAVAMTITGVMMITMMIPKVSKNITDNRQRAFAAQFADSRLAELKAQAYQYIPLTPEADLAGCNCSTANMSTLAVDSTTVNSGILFQRRVCVNLTELSGTTWTHLCPDNPLTSARDKGLKYVRVESSWIYANETHRASAQGLVVNP